MDLFKLKNTHAMTFIEVVIAIAIAAIVSLGMYSSAVFTMRQTERSVEQIQSVQIANSAAAKARVARFDTLAAGPAAGDYEAEFTKAHTISTDTNKGAGGSPISTSYNVDYKLKGFGKGVAASGLTATLTIPAHGASWAANEFAGHFLVITGGKGSNQVMLIVSNAASTGAANAQKKVTVTLNKSLDGTTNTSGWDITPDATSSFAVDYGLYCEIEVKWGAGDAFRTVTETVYVPAA